MTEEKIAIVVNGEEVAVVKRDHLEKFLIALNKWVLNDLEEYYNEPNFTIEFKKIS